MRRVKKVFKWFFGVLFSLVILLVILGYIFEDKIHLMAIKELGKQLNARIEVRDTDVSFISGFPYIHVELKDLVINPKEQHHSEDFIRVGKLSLWLNFWSFFSDTYEIVACKLYEPDVKMILDKEGRWNYAGMFEKESEEEEITLESEEEEILFELSGVNMYGGRFEYRDDQSGDIFKTDSLEVEMEGDFASGSTDLKAKLEFWLEDWKGGSMAYSGKHIAADLDLDAGFGDQVQYKLRDGQLRIASMVLDLSGEVKEEPKGYRFDLAYQTNENSFRSFLSLIPANLLETGESYEYSGDFQVSGWMRGLAGGGSAPDIYADYSVREGTFYYVGYPAKLSGVSMKGSFLQSFSKPLESKLLVDDFKANLNDRSVSGNLTYANFADPRIDFALKGELDLQDLKSFSPHLTENTAMEGLLGLDVRAGGRIEDFRNENFSRITADGSLAFSKVRLEDPSFPLPIERVAGLVYIDNNQVRVDRLAAKVGRSDINLSGTVTQYLPYFFDTVGVMKGRLTLTSNRLDLNEWLQQDGSGEQIIHNASETMAEYRYPDIERLDLSMTTNIRNFSMGQFKANQVSGNMRLHPEGLNLNSVFIEALSGNMEVTGKLTTLNPKNLGFDLDANVKQIEVSKAFQAFDQLAAFALVKDNLTGEFSGTIHLDGALGPYMDIDSRTFRSYGNIELKHGHLVDFEPLEAMAGFVKLEDLQDVRFSDVNTTYHLEEGWVNVPELKVWANDYFLELNGRHGLDNSLDYHVIIQLPQKEAKKSGNDRVLALVEEESDPKKPIRIPVKVYGTVDEPRFGLEGKVVKEQFKENLRHEGQEVKDGFDSEVKEIFGDQDTLGVDDMIEEVPSDNTGKGFKLPKIKNPFKRKSSR